MNILLLGECSNLHWTLAQGLRQLGHNVTVASDGSRWMDNDRNINLKRTSYSKLDSIKFLYNIFSNLDRLKGYDIVQIKNPIFIDLKAAKNLWLYKFLKKHNKKVFLGAFATDYYWIRTCLDGKSFRYSEFCIGNKQMQCTQAQHHINEWMGTEKEKINREIAETCNGIIACLYEYYVPYAQDYKEKLTFIPEPINTQEIKFVQRCENVDKVKFFIGLQKDRSQFKGTDILYEMLQEVHSKYPDESLISKAESLPYNKYVNLMSNSDVLLDQLYSYTPGMNAFAAMAQGLVVVGGGEPEGYEILNEYENRPIINVLPDREDVYNKLENLIKNKNQIADLSRRSRMFVEKHHDYIKVAKQYLDFWEKQ